MNESSRERLHLILAIIQTLGAVLASVSLLGIKQESFNRFVGWLVVPVSLIALALLAYSRRRRVTLDYSAAESAESSNTVMELPQVRSRRHILHRMVVFTLWSILAASVVVYLGSHLVGLLLVGMAPLWIGVGAFLAIRIARDHRFSAVLLGGLFCGAFGAWLALYGSPTLQFGSLWGGLAGALVADYFFEMDPYMSLWSGIVGTLILGGSVALMLRPYDDFMLESLDNFIRAGFPFLLVEGMLLIVAYSSGSLLNLLKKERHRAQRSRLEVSGSRAKSA